MKATDTRRLYAFEEAFKHALPYAARRERTLASLTALLHTVWAKYGRKRLPPPRLTFGDGMPYAGGRASFADGFGHIELVAGHRVVAILLHETTHTLGYTTHGPGFVTKYFELLVEYGGCSEGELALAAALFKLNKGNS